MSAAIANSMTQTTTKKTKLSMKELMGFAVDILLKELMEVFPDFQ